MADNTVYDLEWHALASTGRLRTEFNRLRKRVDELEQENRDLRVQVAQWQEQARSQDRVVVVRAPVVVTPNPPPSAPIVSQPPPPSPLADIPGPEEETDLDDSRVRFNLLELD